MILIVPGCIKTKGNPTDVCLRCDARRSISHLGDIATNISCAQNILAHSAHLSLPQDLVRIVGMEIPTTMFHARPVGEGLSLACAVAPSS